MVYKTQKRMAKIIYLEDTITLMANTKNGMELVQRLAKIGEFKQTENGYRYIVIENNNEADGRK
jgi:hypothetical protein